MHERRMDPVIYGEFGEHFCTAVADRACEKIDVLIQFNISIETTNRNNTFASQDS